jgi:hypothetical protein
LYKHSNFRKVWQNQQFFPTFFHVFSSNYNFSPSFPPMLLHIFIFERSAKKIPFLYVWLNPLILKKGCLWLLLCLL